MHIQQPAPIEKTTLVLRRDLLLFLDNFTLRMRAKSGVVITRSALIRALVEALRMSGVMITTAVSEQQVANALAACISRGADTK